VEIVKLLHSEARKQTLDKFQIGKYIYV